MADPQVVTWESAKADAFEVEADNIEIAILDIRRIEPMFMDRPEIREAGNVYRSLLEFEVLNIRTRADKLRGKTASE